ncbi:MAG TPA: ATP-dependent 6-phosphofructokinase [Acidobacteriota bacterium]|jgi:6-phosphofructokinase 1|nr:ATP-dependent 6-phosphofructokinase [Acidobacteriota bacterium]
MQVHQHKRITVVNGGGDAPGLNAVIRAVVKTAILRYGWEVWGSEDSFDGFIKPGKMIPMTLDTVRGILPRGGTILGTTNRGNPFRYPERDERGEVVLKDYSDRVMQKMKEMGFDAMVLIGGDGTLTIGQMFVERGLPIVGVPKTIDQDLQATETTFGFDTATKTVMEALDMIHTTAESHERVMVVEVMGRNAGWIALQAGISGGADIILIPEIPFRIEKVVEKIEARQAAGRPFSIIVVSEGATPVGGSQIYREKSIEDPFGKLGGIGAMVVEMLRPRIQLETRVVVLGHLQRGGSPTAFDRLLGTRFGVAAVDLVAQNQFGRMVALDDQKITSVPITDAIARQRLVDPNGELVHAARSIGISLGD